MVEMAPRRPAGTGNVVWSLKRFFAFLNAAGLSDVRIDGLLAHAAAGPGAAPSRSGSCTAGPPATPRKCSSGSRRRQIYCDTACRKTAFRPATSGVSPK
jgi:hypothetical protein